MTWRKDRAEAADSRPFDARLRPIGASPGQRRWWKPIALGVFGLLALLMVIGVLAPPPPASKEPASIASKATLAKPSVAPASRPKAIMISAADLDQRFKDNEIAAGNAFDGKPVLVTGAIAKISEIGGVFFEKDIAGIDLSGSAPFRTVMALMPNEADALHMVPDEEISLRCAGVRLSLGSVVLDDCHPLPDSSGEREVGQP